MYLKTSKSWLYLFQKPSKSKNELEELYIDSKIDPQWKRMIAGLSWFGLSMSFVVSAVYCLVFFFDFIFGVESNPCVSSWLSFENNMLASILFIASLIMIILIAFCVSMVLWTYCIRSLHFVRESSIELIGRKGMFIFINNPKIKV